MEQKFRTETDSMGAINVPYDKYWRAQTQRALIHFSIADDIMLIEMLHFMNIIKKSAALTNLELGLLKKTKANLIIKVAEEIVEDKLGAHFPLHVWVTGSGTQSKIQ